MNNYRFIINSIYWERIQLFIEGYIENVDVHNGKIVLRNLTETKELEANELKIEGNRFKARFNIAILDSGNYLSSGDYLVVLKSKLSYTAQINEKWLKPDNYKIDEEQRTEYENLKTQNDKNNYLLSYFKKEFKNGGTSEKVTYTVTPKISKEVNEFVLEVFFKQRIPKKNVLASFINKYKKQYYAKSFEIRMFLFKFIFYITKFFRVKKGKTVLFTSDSRADMSGNFKFVYEEMLKRNLDQKYKIHCIFKTHISLRRKFIDKFRLPYLLGKADYIFVDDFHPLLYKVKFRKNQEIIQLWHAVGAFKTVGFSRVGKKGGPFFDSPNHRNYTKAFVSSENDILFYGEAFGIKEQNIIPTGVARTDIFFKEDYRHQIEFEMKRTLPIINDKKVILFAPTFRGNGFKTAYYPFFKIDFTRLAHYCEKNNAVVLFKMHPFVRNRLKIPNQYRKYFIDISNFREVNDILFVTDILISDYSSLVYEFATFKRPMLFYAFDLEDYVTSRDFYEDYESFVPGKIVETFEELLNSLEKNDFELEKVECFLNKHFKYLDGRASERVVRHIFGTR
ncbi:CDP-glycerol glycerophosphotransferase family protein [Staphylococcus pseudintermedius]|nr:CDP-glycerol glycerophosphotransferase family protein [Staphylococcus pseudintermedius]